MTIMKIPFKKPLKEGLKNIVFLVGGVAMYDFSPQLLAPAIGMIILMYGSGFHHWNLEAEKYDTDLSRLADYVGMYAVTFGLIVVSFGVFGIWSVILMTGLTAIGALLLRSNRIFLGALFGAVLLLLIIHAPIYEVLDVVGWLAVSIYMNYVGDKVNEEHHHFIHGFIWHTLITVTAVKGAMLLINNL